MPLDTPDLTELTTATQKLVTFTSSDVLSGVSYIDYYAGKTINGAVLTRTPLPSYYRIGTDIGYQTSFAAGAVDTDFDVTFAEGITFKGEAIISMQVYSANAGATRTTNTITVYLRHWDGTTETQLGTATANYDPENDGAGYETFRTFTFSMDLAHVHFAVGDTLRFTLVGTQSTNGGAVVVQHDPSNFKTQINTITLDTGRLTVSMPTTIE